MSGIGYAGVSEVLYQARAKISKQSSVFLQESARCVLLINIVLQEILYGTRALQMAGTIILRLAIFFIFSMLWATLIRPLVLVGRSGGPGPSQHILG